MPSFEQKCLLKSVKKQAVKGCVIYVEIMWVSNYRYPITKSSNQIPVSGHPRDYAPTTRQIGAQRTNHEACLNKTQLHIVTEQESP